METLPASALLAVPQGCGVWQGCGTVDTCGTAPRHCRAEEGACHQARLSPGTGVLVILS